ncbi:protein-disulfide reductase [Ranunculus cassubicifolius]
MWLSAKGNPEKNDEGNGLVAVGLDRDKGSQHALKWAVDHILSRGQTVILVHVKVKSSQSLPASRGTVTTFDNVEALRRSHIDQQTKELFLPFRFFCTRKDVVCRNVVLEDTDVAKALIEYVSNSAIETLVIGASSKHGFLKRFKSTDISSNVSKHAPDFCNVYVINKGKIASMRTASCAAPTITPRLTQMRSQPSSCKSEPPHPHLTHSDSSKWRLWTCIQGYLDHTAVAIKILRPDASQGRSQFQQEIEVLSNIRHPNMVLLLGACPEYGCLVYEYMANGSLEDCLFRKGDKPVLSWQLRFRIAAEIGTGLLFLHQTKPEPLVHRDLKPGNILLDQNYTSKISDVGLARLVPPSVSNSITQLRMTSTAGTFCYIDPEYQQTGMLGVKSDIYSLGIMLLQLVTAKNAMGLAHHAQKAIDNGTFGEMLDPAVPDWPVEEAVGFAKLALRCAELRRKDRPDLATEILPELERLRSLAEDNMPTLTYGGDRGASPRFNRLSTHQDVMSDHLYLQSAESSNSRISG